MKKLMASFLLFAFTATCLAQSKDSTGRIFKPFKVVISAGYASPQNQSQGSSGSSSSQGANFSGGALFSIEPKYAIIDPLAIGVRFEAAVTAHLNNNNNNSSGGSNNSNAKANFSYILTADYYFMNKTFRPFIGGGAGVYVTASIDSSTVNSSSSVSSIPRTSQFGGMVRAGFEVGHLRLAAEYNFVSNNASYLGLELGIAIGGGRRRR
jgi:outer membrane protein W